MTVSRLAHNALQRIQHPIHAEHRAPFAGYNRMPPAEQQGPVIADPNILPNAVQPEALDTHQIANKKDAPKTVDFNLHGRNVKLPEHAKIDAKDIISMCENGEKIYENLINGNRVEETKDNVAQLMWYLQARASNKVSVSAGLTERGPQNFKMGAFSIEDKGHNIESFLNQAGSYSRKSSHLKEYKNAGADYQSRGLDIDSKNAFLPNNRKTVLFARMPKKSEDSPTGIPDKDMLFIKMEEHGCHKVKDMIRHAFNYIPTVLEQKFGLTKSDGGIDNRERIPSELKEEYTNIRNKYEQTTGEALPSSNALTTTGGVKTMLEDLRTMCNSLDEKIKKIKMAHSTNTGNETIGVPEIQKLKNVIWKMQQKLQLRNYSVLRIGNEIIITNDEPVIDYSNNTLSKDALNNNPKLKVLFDAYMKKRLMTLLNPSSVNNADLLMSESCMATDLRRGMIIKNSQGKREALTKEEKKEFNTNADNAKQVTNEKIIKFISETITSQLPGATNIATEHTTKLSKVITSFCEQSIGNCLTRLGSLALGGESILDANGEIEMPKVETSISFGNSSEGVWGYTITPISSEKGTTVVDLTGLFELRALGLGRNGSNYELMATGPNRVSTELTIRFAMNNKNGEITASAVDAQYTFADDLRFSMPD
ncbi:hypothetical protein ABUS55_15660 [Citrobacter pasteurii]|uniref:hypothetical protein n=1 Tax=Citrobacter pasteurii TaxID=1563222 RepID=UPI00352E4666